MTVCASRSQQLGDEASSALSLWSPMRPWAQTAAQGPCPSPTAPARPEGDSEVPEPLGGAPCPEGCHFFPPEAQTAEASRAPAVRLALGSALTLSAGMCPSPNTPRVGECPHFHLTEQETGSKSQAYLRSPSGSLVLSKTPVEPPPSRG